MNLRAAKFLIPALMFTAACADSTVETDLPPDAEFGIESSEGRADSYGVRPGTPEAEAVLAFANQPLANDAAGQQYLTLLDSELHATAAKNIAAFRAGADGAFGTSDDQTFGELKDLDGVRYVGRVALMQLYDLALAAGFDQRGEIPCSDYMDARNGTFYLQTYEDLLVIEQSGCTSFDANLRVSFNSVYMPTRARQMASLDKINRVEGNVYIDVRDSFEVLTMRGLKDVAGTIEVRSQSAHRLEMPELVDTNDMILRNVQEYDFPKLETTAKLHFVSNRPDISGFPVLRETEDFIVNYGSSAGQNYEFPKLEKTAAFHLIGVRNTAPFTGSFDALADVGNVQIVNADIQNLDLNALETVDGAFILNQVREPKNFNGLTEVGAHVHMTNLDFPATAVLDGFGSLKSVGTEMQIHSNRAIDFDAFRGLESIGESLAVTLYCANSKFDGFTKLTEVQSIELNAQRCNVEGFDVLEELPANLNVSNTTGMTGFPKLGLVGGSFYFRPAGDQGFKSLVFVARDFRVSVNGATDLTGFDELEVVEGNFRLDGSLNQLSGFGKLDGVGRNVSLPNRMDRAHVDRLIDQLSQFSGSVSFN